MHFEEKSRNRTIHSRTLLEKSRETVGSLAFVKLFSLFNILYGDLAILIDYCIVKMKDVLLETGNHFVI